MPTGALIIAGFFLALIAAVIVVRFSRRRRLDHSMMARKAEIARIRLDEDTSEIRRGDRPEPPAPPAKPGPDNLEPFARPSSEDERR